MPEQAKQKIKEATPTSEKAPQLPPRSDGRQSSQQQQQQQQQRKRNDSIQHPDEYISSLMALGASREQAIAALDAANGNLDVAAGIIFSE